MSDMITFIRCRLTKHKSKFCRLLVKFIYSHKYLEYQYKCWVWLCFVKNSIECKHCPLQIIFAHTLDYADWYIIWRIKVLRIKKSIEIYRSSHKPAKGAATEGENSRAEVNVGIRGVLRTTAMGIPTGICTEEGIGQQTCHLLLTHGQTVAVIFLQQWNRLQEIRLKK